MPFLKHFTKHYLCNSGFAHQRRLETHVTVILVVFSAIGEISRWKKAKIFFFLQFFLAISPHHIFLQVDFWPWLSCLVSFSLVASRHHWGSIFGSDYIPNLDLIFVIFYPQRFSPHRFFSKFGFGTKTAKAFIKLHKLFKFSTESWNFSTWQTFSPRI